MNVTYLYFIIICFVLAAISLVAAIAMFFGFHVPMLFKDMHGVLEQKQINEIRNKNALSQHQRNKVNVFEELEKNAKLKRDTGSVRLNRKTQTATQRQQEGTDVLPSQSRGINPNFVIEKNIVFVSTDEVI